MKPDGALNEALRQVGLADVILVNKIDLVTKEQLSAIKQRIRWDWSMLLKPYGGIHVPSVVSRIWRVKLGMHVVQNRSHTYFTNNNWHLL